MSTLLGVLPLLKPVTVPGVGSHVLTPDDLDMWARDAAGTPVHFGGTSGHRPRLAGHVDKVRLDKGRMFVWGDLDPALPGGADARWGVKDSGVFDRLGAQLLARPDPLRNLPKAQRETFARHWGGWPQGDAGVLIASVSVSAIGIAPGAQWLGA